MLLLFYALWPQGHDLTLNPNFELYLLFLRGKKNLALLVTQTR